MQIVIDVPDKTYEKIMSNEYDYGDMNVIIQNGTPLPKGHGRLGDLDYLYEKFKANKCSDELVFRFIKDEPTIIEAEKEVENGEIDGNSRPKKCPLMDLDKKILTPNELAQRLMDERIHGELKEDIQYIKDVIEDVKCKLSVEIIDHRPCYCGAELREVWRNADSD